MMPDNLKDIREKIYELKDFLDGFNDNIVEARDDAYLPKPCCDYPCKNLQFPPLGSIIGVTLNHSSHYPDRDICGYLECICLEYIQVCAYMDGYFRKVRIRCSHIKRIKAFPPCDPCKYGC